MSANTAGVVSFGDDVARGGAPQLDAIMDRRSKLGISSTKKVLRRNSLGQEMPEIEWIPLLKYRGPATARSSWDEIVALNSKREELLGLARTTSPIDTILILRLLPRTVIPRMIKHKLFWVIFVAYLVTLIIARSGNGADQATVQAIVDSSTTFVAFTIVFFVGAYSLAPPLLLPPAALGAAHPPPVCSCFSALLPPPCPPDSTPSAAQATATHASTSSSTTSSE